MRWQDLPSSQNIQPGTPLPWAERETLADRPEFSAPQQYGIKRYLDLVNKTPTPEQLAFLSRYMPTISTTPLPDPSAASDPSILARQRMPAQPWNQPWQSTYYPQGFPGPLSALGLGVKP